MHFYILFLSWTYLTSQFLNYFHFNQSVSRKLQVKIFQLMPSCCTAIVWFSIPLTDVTALKQTLLWYVVTMHQIDVTQMDTDEKKTNKQTNKQTKPNTTSCESRLSSSRLLRTGCVMDVRIVCLFHLGRFIILGSWTLYRTLTFSWWNDHQVKKILNNCAPKFGS